MTINLLMLAALLGCLYFAWRGDRVYFNAQYWETSGSLTKRGTQLYRRYNVIAVVLFAVYALLWFYGGDQ